jgi:hypothetical protein
MNGDVATPLRVPTRAELRDWAETVDIQPEPSHGAVVVQIGRAPGNGIDGATAAVEGPTPDARPLYFRAGQKAGPNPGATSTLSNAPIALFLGLDPGVYTLTGGRMDASQCVTAGDDRPDPIVLDVRAGELTDAGWIICRQ